MKTRKTHDTAQSSRFDHGFTLVEMIIVVAIIAILAGVAVVAYQRHVRSGRVVSAHEFISQIQARQETYFQQHGVYVATHSANFYPPLASNDEPRMKSWTAPPAGWVSLGARPPGGGTTFSYLVLASDPAATPPHRVAAGSPAASLGIPQPAAGMAPRPWYLVVAHADLDGDAAYTNGRCANDLLTPNDCTSMTATSARSAVIVQNQGE